MIGLINIEPIVVNTAYMQISSFFKQHKQDVAWWTPEIDPLCDHVFCSSLFDFTDRSKIPERAFVGGSGVDKKGRLPDDLEKQGYDYSIYPDCDFSILWFSRGCVRRCPFCIVYEKEGRIHTVDPKNLNPAGKYIKVQDNNFFAAPNWREAVKTLVAYKQPVDFSSGIDIRLFQEEQGVALKSIRLTKRIHTAWDNPKEDVTDQFKLLFNFLKPYRIICYVLVGYWSTPEEDLYRVEKLREWGVDPYVMPFNKKDQYQNWFARWVNRKAIFKSATWREYEQTQRNKLVRKINLVGSRFFKNT